MLAILSPTELAYGFGILTVGVFLLTTIVKRPRWLRSIFDKKISAAQKSLLGRGRLMLDAITAAMQAAGLVAFVLTAVNMTNAWRLLWLPNEILDLNKTVFPDLNGRWEGLLVSNGPQHGAWERPEEEVACPAFRWLGDKKFRCFGVSVSISMSLFETNVRLDQGDTSRHPRSFSRGVSLMRGKSLQNHQIMYLFEADDPIDGKFKGAAILEVAISNAFMLEGGYWTDRRWREGKNTAGFVSLTRKP